MDIIDFKNLSCMIRDVTMCNVSCNLSRNRLTFSRTGWKLFSNSEFLLAAQCCETRCNWDVTQCNAKKNALQRCGNRFEKKTLILLRAMLLVLKSVA